MIKSNDMKIFFQIEYHTVWGEEVRIQLCQDGKENKYIALSTTDGINWKKEVDVKGDFTYTYYIFRNGEPARKEWNINPRTVQSDGERRTFIMNDAWRDVPGQSYYFSSAFTECVMKIKGKKYPKENFFSKNIRIIATAPQLENGQSLAVCGNQKELGNWNTKKPVLMREKGIHQWSLDLDASQISFPLEYKFIAYDEKHRKVLDWETNNNRFMDSIFVHENESVQLSDIEVNFNRPSWKGAGTAIPVFSLRSNESFGVGDFGDLKKLIDWASFTHQKLVQILPINDTIITHTWMDSYPYNSISIYAFHPMYLDVKAMGTLKDTDKTEIFAKKQKELNTLPQIDYEAVNNVKAEYVKLLFEQEGKKVLASAGFKKFFAENKHWLLPYAAFSYLRDENGTPDFRKWKSYQTFKQEEIEALCASGKPCHKDISLIYYIQYNLHIQLLEASKYARSKGIILKGDIPIGISRNSVEAWIEPYYFNMNGQAGAPPDDFSVNGQNWGFPTYNWDVMEKDGYQWWVRRFKKMAEYFDAYRIDHILGFFRIWEVPLNAVHGLLGQFVPSLPLNVDEIQSYGLGFRKESFTRPFINDHVLERIFGPHTEYVKNTFIQPLQYDLYEMKTEFDTQRKVEAYFEGKKDDTSIWIRDGLYSLISDVLFVEDRTQKGMYHPRIAVQHDFVYEALSWQEKEAFNHLYDDYYYRRHNQFWYNEAMKKLPILTQATRMLVCGEDLGMIPNCVPAVMKQLQILSLEIQRMPKNPDDTFGHVHNYPYRSVCTISSHDTSTLRGWWEEDYGRTNFYFHEELRQWGEAPATAAGWICEEIITRHLYCPSMLCILTLQDWMSMDEKVRYPDAQAERINVPANPRHYWRYRMHLSLEDLMECNDLNSKIRSLIDNSGRNQE